MIENVKSRFDWLFSSHYKMERFGCMFGALVLAMCVLLGTIIARKMALDKQTLGNNVIYTTEFEMSLSGNKGKVLNVLCSDDRTQCFILMKWDDMSKVVTDARQYELFLTGTNLDMVKEDLTCRPSASIFMFGSTGYMGIYLVDMNGFQSQILYLALRCNMLATAAPTDIPDYADATFAQYDQAKIYVNPGASDYTSADFLNQRNLDTYEIYQLGVVASEEASVRGALTSDLAAMDDKLARIREYEARVVQAGITVPPMPVEIAGDSITKNEDGTYQFTTNYIVSGGYDFDWQAGDVRSGYLQYLTPSNQTDLQYLTSQRAKRGNMPTMDTSSLLWLRADGTEFNLETVSSLSESEITTKNAITNLITAWQEYYSLKYRYQTEDVEKLLILEYNAKDVSKNYTVNAENNITLW